jgi:hypothetical protein
MPINILSKIEFSFYLFAIIYYKMSSSSPVKNTIRISTRAEVMAARMAAVAAVRMRLDIVTNPAYYFSHDGICNAIGCDQPSYDCKHHRRGPHAVKSTSVDHTITMELLQALAPAPAGYCSAMGCFDILHGEWGPVCSRGCFGSHRRFELPLEEGLIELLRDIKELL